jgi:uncharacterized membrane protein YoaK (UPF0700 family)
LDFPPWMLLVTVLVSAYLLVILLGHLIVRGILERFTPDDGKKMEGMKGAGMAIGTLERVLTLTFILLNQYAAIALIFTAKSIARFEELKDRQFSEYYLTGTLSSILVALVAGILAHGLIEGWL